MCALLVVTDSVLAYMHACMHAFMHTCTHAHMHACIDTHTNMHTCMQTGAHIHTYIHTYEWVAICTLWSRDGVGNAAAAGRNS